jgi:hypothetical protein
LVNRLGIHLNGSGTISHAIGQTVGNYDLLEMPAGVSPFILSACLITGYPNASASIGGCRNIFQGHTYSYNRTLRFRSGEVLVLDTNCKLDGNRLLSDFRLQGSSPLADVYSIDPLVESWEPAGPGRIRGHFTAAWRRKTGGLVVADAVTDYRIDTSEEQQEFLHRYIAITSSVEGGHLFKKQDVRLFKQLCSTSS